MLFGQWFSYISCLSLFMGLAITNARVYPSYLDQHHWFFRKIITSPSYQTRHQATQYTTIYVNPNGHGRNTYSTIQSAINSVPSYNSNWICIQVSAGIYKEQVQIPVDKQFIFLKGEGEGNTRVVWDSSDSIATCATFSVHADNTVVTGITFENSYNSPSNPGNPMKAALAAFIQGDKCSFHQCTFVGLQDTLWDVGGRHYFYQSTIYGAVDFIFGSGQSIYEQCTISVTALNGLTGFITAQGRNAWNETNGFVFKNCTVTGNGKAFLGRPWRDYARVLFYNTQLSDVIDPEGWAIWGSSQHKNDLIFSEYGCTGAGSDTSKRVSWEKKLSEQEVQQLASISFIDTEGWLGRQPV